MALRVELKPGERIILGDSVITNANQRTRLVVEGHAPVLREKDIMTAPAATSPARRIYLAVQLMYLSGDTSRFQENYFALVADILAAAPSTRPYVTRISKMILTGTLYKALKEARRLVDYERKILSDASASSPTLSADRSEGGEPA